MMYTEDISSYAELSSKINRAYAKQNQYSFFEFIGRKSARDPRWDKIKVIEDMLDKTDEQGKHLYDFVFWIDADAYFNKFDTLLEEFIYQDYDITMCDDPLTTGINTGTIMIKNSKWSKQLIKLWWKNGAGSRFENDLFHEQDVIDVMYKNDFFGMRKKMLVLPPQTFNSDHSITKNYKYGWNKTFIVHLMGKKNADRKNLINEKLCSIN